MQCSLMRPLFPLFLRLVSQMSDRDSDEAPLIVTVIVGRKGGWMPLLPKIVAIRFHKIPTFSLG